MMSLQQPPRAQMLRCRGGLWPVWLRAGGVGDVGQGRLRAGEVDKVLKVERPKMLEAKAKGWRGIAGRRRVVSGSGWWSSTEQRVLKMQMACPGEWRARVWMRARLKRTLQRVVRKRRLGRWTHTCRISKKMRVGISTRQTEPAKHLLVYAVQSTQLCPAIAVLLRRTPRRRASVGIRWNRPVCTPPGA